MNHWNSYEPELNPHLANLKGAAREEEFLKFMVHAIRSEKAEKKSKATETIEEEKTKHTDVHEWTEEQMDYHMGPKRAATLRELKAFRKECCPYTGSTLPHMMIHIVQTNGRA